MNSLQSVLLESISDLSKNDMDFYKHVRKVFPINTLCEMLGINRNRYNYLYKRGLLYKEIMNLRSKKNEL